MSVTVFRLNCWTNLNDTCHGNALNLVEGHKLLFTVINSGEDVGESYKIRVFKPKLSNVYPYSRNFDSWIQLL